MNRAGQVSVTRKFLHFSVTDADDLDEVGDEVARRAAVAVDANTSLDDPSDSGAIEYLHQIAAAVRAGPRRATGV